MRQLRRHAALLSGLLFVPHPARSAQEGTPGTELYLGDIVTIATRTKKPLDLAPGSVSHVTRSEMEKRGVQTADQALNALPGVFDRRGKGFMDTSAAVTLRGIPDQKRTLVLLDGIPLNDAYTGAVAYGGLPVEDIRSIEVVKGPFSSLYGGSAMGGVVNIIPRRPDSREFTLKGGYGTGWRKDSAMDNLVKGYASYGDRFKDKLSVFLSCAYKGTDGYPSDLNVQSSRPSSGLTGWSDTTDNKGSARYLIGDKGDNAWREKNLALRAWYDLSKDSRIGVAYSRTDYDYSYGDPHTYLQNAAGEALWSYGTVKEASFLAGSGGRRQNFASAKYETRVSETKVELSLGLLDAEKAWYTTPGTTASTTRLGGPGKISETPAQAYSAELQAAFPPAFGRHTLTAGTSFRHAWAHTMERDLADWRDLGTKGALTYQSKGKNRDYSLYLQDEVALLDNLTAYLGARQDWWETFDGFAEQPGTAGYPIAYGRRDALAFSPKASVVYKPFERTTLKMSGGKAFRPPTVYELYRTWTSGTLVYSANPDLQPESATSWDAEVSQRLWEGAEVKTSYFEHRLKDLIYRQTVSSTLQQYVNAGRAFIQGVEVEGQQRVLGGLRVFGNFTYNDAKITENSAKPDSVGKRLVDVPQRMFNFGAEAEKGILSLSMSGRYVGKRFTDDTNTDVVNGVYGTREPYLTVDTRISCKLTRYATVSFSVSNVFDERYYDYYRAPGRSWFTELATRF